MSTGHCPYCGVPVVISDGGAFALAVDGEKDVRIYCQPKNLPGGVPDDRVFPLHAFTRNTNLEETTNAHT